MIGPRTRTGYEHESLLSEERLAQGLTYQKLSELTGELPQRLAQLSTGTVAPVSLRTGEILPWVERTCLVLGVPPEELFPRYFCTMRGETAEEPEKLIPEDYLFSEDTVQILTEPAETTAERRELLRLVPHPLDDKPRLQRTIELRILWDQTLDEVAKVMGCTRERARQMEAKGLALMNARKKEIEQ